MLVLTLTAIQTLDYAAKGSRIEDRLGQILGLRSMLHRMSMGK